MNCKRSTCFHVEIWQAEFPDEQQPLWLLLRPEKHILLFMIHYQTQCMGISCLDLSSCLQRIENNKLDYTVTDKSRVGDIGSDQ